MPHDVIKICISKGSSANFGMTLLGDGPCVVSDVVAGGPAAKAGVQASFVVLEIDGTNVTSNSHKEVREMISSVDPYYRVSFKFSTLDSACLFFGDRLRSVFDNSKAKKRRSSTDCSQKSPRKAEENQPDLILRTRHGISVGQLDETKENAGMIAVYHSVAVQADSTHPGNDNDDDAEYGNSSSVSDPPSSTSRNTKPTRTQQQIRNGAAIQRQSNVQLTRDLTRWMRASDQHPLRSPNVNHISPITPSNSSEYICEYFDYWDDPLGPPKESVFKKHVDYLKRFDIPAKYWVRLVFTDKRLTIWNSSGKYATCSAKHIHDVFLHDCGLFFGFCTARPLKIRTNSPGPDCSQQMNVFSCHILRVQSRASHGRLTEILAQLFGDDWDPSKAVFPETALEIIPVLKSFASKSTPPQNTPSFPDPIHSEANRLSFSFTSSLPVPEENDVTRQLCEPNVIRRSMRRYGPYGELSRNSISSESLPRLMESRNQNRLSFIDGLPTRYPKTILENDDSSQMMTESSVFISSDHCTDSTKDIPSSSSLRHSKIYINNAKQSVESARPDLFQVLNNDKSLNLFQAFLAQEHSEENTNFWIACQEYRNIKKSKDMKNAATKIYNRFLSVSASEPINVDSTTRKNVQKNLLIATTSIFDPACKQVFDLMNTDSFPRFLKSAYFLQLMQILYPGSHSFSSVQSMPSLHNLTPDRSLSISTPRHSGFFSWLSKKKNDELDTTRQSLPAFCDTTPDLLSPEKTVQNPLQKLLAKGRKSFSARIKPTKRESLSNVLTESISHNSRSKSPSSSIEFRKPYTPPPKKTEVVVMRRNPKPSSAGKEKRLSLQGLQRTKNKTSTEATDWTFARSSMNFDVPGTPPLNLYKNYSARNARHHI